MTTTTSYRPERCQDQIRQLNDMVSIVILNYNNKDFLRKSITSALELDWPELEVIVVDNASSDGSHEMIESEFGNRIRLIRRQDNSAAAGRNEGFNTAVGNYVLSIDNDIVLTDRMVVRKAMSLFTQFPTVALLAFKVGSVENPEEPLPEHWWYPVPMVRGKDQLFFTDFFSEGAVFFRSEAIKASGGYDEMFCQYYEGNDLALRLTRDGYDLLYCSSLSCAELRIRGFLGRSRNRVNYLSLRNKIWTAWKHYPLKRACPYLLGRIAVSAFRSARFGWFDLFVTALRDGFLAPYAIRVQRQPLNKETWAKIRDIHKGKFPEAIARKRGATCVPVPRVPRTSKEAVTD